MKTRLCEHNSPSRQQILPEETKIQCWICQWKRKAPEEKEGNLSSVCVYIVSDELICEFAQNGILSKNIGKRRQWDQKIAYSQLLKGSIFSEGV